MSVAVSLQTLWDRVQEFGESAYLVTTATEHGPHVVSVVARVDGSNLVVGGGRTTRANARANPAVTLLWPPAPGDASSLIVDGQATVTDETEDVVIAPTRAVLHRVAGVAGDGPGCVAVLDPPS